MHARETTSAYASSSRIDLCNHINKHTHARAHTHTHTHTSECMHGRQRARALHTTSARAYSSSSNSCNYILSMSGGEVSSPNTTSIASIKLSYSEKLTKPSFR